MLVAALMEFLEPFTTRNNLMVRPAPPCGSRHGHVWQWSALAAEAETRTPGCSPLPARGACQRYIF